jgi:hypothetical protein
MFDSMVEEGERDRILQKSGNELLYDSNSAFNIIWLIGET